jgi:hypothetical protein
MQADVIIQKNTIRDIKALLLSSQKNGLKYTWSFFNSRLTRDPIESTKIKNNFRELTIKIHSLSGNEFSFGQIPL